jgi:hypothetical protein
MMMTMNSPFSSSILEEIVPESTRRFEKLPEGWSVFDILEHTGHRFPNNIWFRILKKYPEIEEDISWIGPRNRQQPYVTDKGAVYLLTLLPGEIGREYRSLVFETLWVKLTIKTRSANAAK